MSDPVWLLWFLKCIDRMEEGKLLAHCRIDPEAIFGICQTDIPALTDTVRKMIEELP